MKPSVVILTFNEEINLPRCLSSLQALEPEIFIVDSGSTDRTHDIAAHYDATVVHHPFETHALQWAWALNSLPLRGDWVLALDADQKLTPEAVQELLGLEPDSAVNGYYIKRRQVFRGRWIKHGGYYPKYLLKLFRRDKVIIDANDLLDHHFYVSGPTAKLNYDLIEENTKEDDIAFWIEKHNRYSTLMAREEHLRKQGVTSPLQASLFGSPDQRMLRLKAGWRKLPLMIRPVCYFFYRYILRAGWLDGKEGFIFHFLQGFWFRLLVDIKLDELLHPPATPELYSTSSTQHSLK